MLGRLVFASLLSALVARAALAQPVGGEKAFKRMDPSVVVIESDESLGSGVVMGREGLILTCLHVANTPLPLRVRADAMKDGVRMTLTFDDVKLTKAHTRYDLAYIEVALPPGVTLIPIEQAKRAPVTGEVCFAVGNPGGADGQTLTKTCTAGLVSAAKRRLEGLEYIQTSAAVNPGNSGGALCDKEGNLLGIVTLKLDEREAIGFAIPTFGLRQTDFLPMAQRRGDRRSAARLVELGNQCYRAAMRLLSPSARGNPS